MDTRLGELAAGLGLAGVELPLQDRQPLVVPAERVALLPRRLHLLTKRVAFVFERVDVAVLRCDGLTQRLLDPGEGLLPRQLGGQVGRGLRVQLRVAIGDDRLEPGAIERVLARHAFEGVEGRAQLLE